MGVSVGDGSVNLERLNALVMGTSGFAGPQILHQHRHATEGAVGERVDRCDRLVEVAMDNRVDVTIDGLHASDARLERLRRGQLTGTDGLGKTNGIDAGEFGIHTAKSRQGRAVGPNTLHIMSEALEEGLEVQLDFDKVGKIGRAGHQVVPVVLQDADSGDVLFIGYANEEAYRETLARGSAVLYSTSREQIWHKGATSGDVLDLVEVAVNCEQNSLIYKVRKAGTGVCHTKDEAGQTRQTCYYRAVEDAETLRFT